MALHLAANGCYGVMIYNNKDYPDSYINEELKKYGKVHEAQKGGKNLIFIYYKQYEEARACLDALSSDPDFNAKPAKPRETSRAVVSYGARERAKSVGERVRNKFEPYSETKRIGDKTERDKSYKEEDQHPLRKRSMSITNISVEKVENSTIADKSDVKESSETKEDNTEEPKLNDQSITVELKQKTPFRPRSKSVGRLNVEDEAKRAELIKKVINCENNAGGSLDSLFEKEIVDTPDKENNASSTPWSQLKRSKSFHENLANSDCNDSWQKDRRKSNLWLTPKPSFYKPWNGNTAIKREFNKPYLLPAMTIYEDFVIGRQPKKFSHIVVVTGLPLYITEEYLCDLCAKFARVLRIRLIDTRNIQECRAYVYVKSKRDAINLKRNIDKKILFCHIVEVTILSDIKNILPFVKY
ncbi:uncharacterized protein [Halyomorpha halys]|uniref:uncharacterized protein n=1 Tax=Halyomorpha halys TaxID=286706 RepID=UPI0006D4EB67|nr:uncharacterized protein LOC106686981 [Halyomorpha halys]